MANMKSNMTATVAAWLILLSMTAGLMLLVNRKSFRNQTTVPQSVVEQLDFPLKKVTVDLKKKEFMQFLRDCPWIDASNNIGSISLSPSKGNENEFRGIVNEYDNAEKLANLYKEQGFRWNNAKAELTLPVRNGSVSVPSWVVFQLVQEGYVK